MYHLFINCIIHKAFYLAKCLKLLIDLIFLGLCIVCISVNCSQVHEMVLLYVWRGKRYSVAMGEC